MSGSKKPLPAKPKPAMEQKVDRALAALRLRKASHYEAWKLGDGWQGAPIYGDRLPGLDEIRRTGGVCSTAINIAFHVNDLTPPMVANFRGGTGAYSNLAERIGEPFKGAGTILRPGDIIGSPYTGAKLARQGHIAIVTTGGLPREAKLLQWDAFAGKKQPGLNEYRTVAATNRRLSRPSKWQYILRRERWLG